MHTKLISTALGIALLASPLIAIAQSDTPTPSIISALEHLLVSLTAELNILLAQASSTTTQTQTAAVAAPLTQQVPPFPSSRTQFFTDLYQCILNRAPDANGLAYWVAQPSTMTLGSIYQAWFSSAEYLSQHTSNEKFVTQLYNCVDWRQPDTGGYNGYLQALQSGTKTRSWMVTAFVTSNEFSTHQGPKLSIATGFALSSAISKPTTSISADNTNITVGQSTTIHATFTAGSGDSLLNTDIDEVAAGTTNYVNKVFSGAQWGTPVQSSLSYTYTPTAPGAYNFYTFVQTKSYPSWWAVNPAQVTVNVATSSVPKSCLFDNVTIASGLSIPAFSAPTVLASGRCTQETRTCTNGALSGSYKYVVCYPQPVYTDPRVGVDLRNALMNSTPAPTGLPFAGKKVVLWGDSTTQGLHNRGYQDQFNQVFPGATVYNYGVSGDRLSSWNATTRNQLPGDGVTVATTSASYQDMVRLQPDYIFLRIGIGDLNGQIDPDTLSATMGTFLDSIHRDIPHAYVFVLSPIPNIMSVATKLFQRINNGAVPPVVVQPSWATWIRLNHDYSTLISTRNAQYGYKEYFIDDAFLLVDSPSGMFPAPVYSDFYLSNSPQDPVGGNPWPLPVSQWAPVDGLHQYSWGFGFLRHGLGIYLGTFTDQQDPTLENFWKGPTIDDSTFVSMPTIDPRISVANASGLYPDWGAADLVKSSQDVLSLGFSSMELYLSPEICWNPTGYHRTYGIYETLDWCRTQDPYIGYGALNVASITELAQNPRYKAVFALPFKTFILTSEPNSYTTAPFYLSIASAAFTQAQYDAIYKEYFDLAAYLDTTYKDTGKTFIIQTPNEMDWEMIGSGDATGKPSAVAVKNAINYWNQIQNAINDARRLVPPVGMHVYGGCELNLVQKGMASTTAITAVNSVLPSTYCDLYGYSSWDTITPQPTVAHASDITKALDYIASKAPPSAAFGHKNVYISEIGLAESQYGASSGPVVAAYAQQALDWGVPYVNLWAMYDNGCSTYLPTNSQCPGYWIRRPDMTLSYLYQAVLAAFGR